MAGELERIVRCGMPESSESHMEIDWHVILVSLNVRMKPVSVS